MTSAESAERRQSGAMTVGEELRRLGGVATREQLLLTLERRALEHAVRSGEVVRSARGRYSLPDVDAAIATAHALTGVLCLTSAALAHGWAVKVPPALPQVALPRNRKPTARLGPAAETKRLRLHPDDIRDGITSQDRTLMDCLRLLDLDEALAVADSALRSGYPKARLLALARDARGTGSARMRTIAGLATAEAANPFESVLRAIALSVPRLKVRPQVSIWERGVFLGRPDLVADDVRAVLVAVTGERTSRLCPACRTAS
jgi:hypothetical protein